MPTNTPLVSIIIPTFNRANLIGETLDSVLAQTYTNWECIVVDDGSRDDTQSLMAAYQKKDPRVQYLKRPEAHLPGGNGARNYGFLQSRGAYIQWFDSDDLLHPEALEKKVKAIEAGDFDFVISKTRYFNTEEEVGNYSFTKSVINFEQYATGPVSWYTPDMLLKREVAEKICFNEQIRSGQEYNYSCKLLLKTGKAEIVDHYLTLRRYTPDSIGNQRRSTTERYLQTRLDAYWLNYLEIHSEAASTTFNKHALLVCISCYFQGYPQVRLPKGFHKELHSVFGIRAVYFYLARGSLALLGKYHYFYRRLKGKQAVNFRNSDSV